MSRRGSRKSKRAPKPWVAGACRDGFHGQCKLAACACACHRRDPQAATGPASMGAWPQPHRGPAS